MDEGLSMATRIEITAKYARAYRMSSKAVKSQLLDEVIAVTGWVFNSAVRNNARVHMLAALGKAVEVIPFHLVGLDCDNGSEFINHDVVAWAADREVFFTRSRPYRRTIKPQSSQRTTTGCAATVFTGDTTPPRCFCC